MERIQGPQPSKTSQESAVMTPPGKVTTVKASPTGAAKGDAAAKAKTAVKPEAEKKSEPVADHDNSLNHVGNKLGDFLQIAIKLFVSLFDAILGKG
jgi:hypothetical protein